MPTEPSRQPTAKLCLVGEERVGKTSLIHRFAHGVYSPEYLRTIGALITKKSVQLPAEGGVPVVMNLMIWDVMGKRVFLELLGEAYFQGVQGVIAVADMSRPETLELLRHWLLQVRDIVGSAPLVILGNKSDLVEDRAECERALRTFAGEFGTPWYVTSAKTGESVEKAFMDVAAAVRHRQRETAAVDA